jgi:hypothetical protein
MWAPGRLIIWHPLKLIFFDISSKLIYWGRGGTYYLLIKTVYLSVNSKWKPELTGTIFPIYSSDVLAPHIVWRPGQLPGWFAP